MSTPFVPPPYPYDRLDELKTKAIERHGEVVDLSIGTPCDDPPLAVIAALSTSGLERGYPPSVGSASFLGAAQRWFERRFDVSIETAAIGATVGSKEFVASVPLYMHLRQPTRDTVLYPAISYPTYEMGATLAGLRAVPVPMGVDGRLEIEAISASDADRALLLWVNSPGNPTGHLDDLGHAAAWGRRHEVPVFSDECYIEFTWAGPGRTILEHGLDGVVSVQSLSKRSNLAGARAGFYAGDRELVHYLREVRKHAGLMVPGPVQAAAVVALDDDQHVDEQRARYLRRLTLLGDVLAEWSGSPVPQPDGAFYLWIPTDDGWAFADRIACDGGAIVSPGEFYGPEAAGYVRVAVVQPDDKIELVAHRLRQNSNREHNV
jgi:aspartate/methionine/tyrosine aminotransferase